MNNPGPYSLAALQIAGELTSEIQEPISNLDGMTAVNLECTLAYGSGGTTCFVIVQTTADGTNWRDIARFDFTTSGATKVANLSGLLSKAVSAYAVLGSEGVFDGFLGNKLRAVVTSTGTYANTTLSVQAIVR